MGKTEEAFRSTWVLKFIKKVYEIPDFSVKILSKTKSYIRSVNRRCGAYTEVDGLRPRGGGRLI